MLLWHTERKVFLKFIKSLVRAINMSRLPSSWLALRDVAIDMPAGPSEVEVLADEICQSCICGSRFAFTGGTWS